MNVTILGTGNLGQQLGRLLIKAGHNTVFGSRQPQQSVIFDEYKVLSITESLRHSDVVVLAVPYKAYDVLLPTVREAVHDKIIVDASNPIDDQWSPVQVTDGSAAEKVQRLLPESQVVKAFNSIFADVLTEQRLANTTTKPTAFIAGDERSALGVVKQLCIDIGTHPIVCGSLFNARYLEAMAHLNIELAIGQGLGTQGAFIYAQL